MYAIIPGSYDPITIGHINIIERSSPMFDKLFVAVMNNDSAKYDSSLSSKEYLFTMEQRLQMVKRSIAHIPNAVAVSSSGRLIDLCDELGASAIIRGLRDESDLHYEMIHAKWNREHNNRAQTIFMPCDEKFAYVSSTAARELISEKNFELLQDYLHADAVDYIKGMN